MKNARRVSIVSAAAASAAAALVIPAMSASAATVYFDVNGSSAGSGVTNGGSYAWRSPAPNANWSSDPDGNLATSAWVNGNDAVFAAGSDVTSSTSATVWAGTSVNDATSFGPINSLKVKSGNWTMMQLTSNSVNELVTITTGIVDIDTDAVVNFNKNISTTTNAGGLTKKGGGTFIYYPGVNSGPIGYSTFLNVDGGIFRRNSISSFNDLPRTRLLVNTSAAFDLNGLGTTMRGVFDGTSGGGTVTNSSTATDATLTIDLASGINATFNGGLTDGTRKLNVSKTGLGTQIFRGANSIAGTTTVTTGGLVLDHTVSNNAKLGNALLSMNNGGTLSLLGNNGAASTQSFTGLTLGTTTSAGGNSLNVTGGNNQDATVAIGALTRTVATAGTINFGVTSNGTGVAKVTTTSPNTGYGLLGTGTATTTTGAAYATLNGLDWATNSNGTVAGTGNVVALSNYTEQNDPAQWATNGHITSGSGGFSGTLGAPTTITSLRFNNAGTANLGTSALTIRSGGILVTPNAGASSLTGGSVTSSVTEALIHQHNTANEFTVGSKVTGGIALTKSGRGTVVLSGTNDYTGVTKVLSGVLTVTADSALGGTGASSNTLILPGGTLELRNTNGASGFTYGANETLTFYNAGSGHNGLGAIYASGGKVTFAGTFDHNSTTLGSQADAVGVADSSELIFTGPAAFNNGNFGSFSKVGAGTMTVKGAWNQGSANATVRIDGGTLKIGGAAGTLTGEAFTANSGTSLVVDNSEGNVADRISNTRAISQNTARFALLGNATAASTESVSNTFNTGHNVLEVQRGSTSAAATLTSIVARSNRSTVLFRGDNLGGGDTGSAASTILFSAAPTLSGGGTLPSVNPGAADVQIIAYGIGQNGTSGDGNTFVTYTTARGVIPLDLATGYATGGINGDPTGFGNVLLKADATVDNGASGRKIGSLLINASASNPQATDITISQAGVNPGFFQVRSGAILKTGENNATITAPVQFGVNTTGVEGIVNVMGAGKLTIGQILATSSGLAKGGDGTLVLNGTGTALSGSVFVNSGKLLVNTAGGAGSGSITVQGTGTLGGSGSTTGAVVVNNAGTLSPGNSPGIFSTGNLSLNSGATYLVEITGADNSNIGSPQFDQTLVTGNVNLNADHGVGSNLVLSVAGLSAGDVGSDLVIISNDGSADITTGTFAGLAQGSIVTSGIYNFTVDYSGGDGNDVVLTVASVGVPEPTTLALVGLGGMALLGRRRRAC